MKLIKKIKLRQLADYQYVYAIFLIVAFRISFFSLDNDFWFTINQGRYILENGFPTKAINSIHDIDFLYQSWGSGTLFYLIYNSLGYIGMMILVTSIFLLTSFFFYKLCYVVSEKKKLSLKITLLMTILYVCCFFATRPHIFTVLNLTILLYLIENYIKTNNYKYLCFLPIITLLEINMHGIYYVVLLVIFIPFLINSFRFKCCDFLESEGYQKKKILVTYLLMIVSGFINPYGYKTIIYGFTSYSSSSLFNNNIVELMAPNFHDISGKVIIICIILVYVLYFARKEKIPLRYYLLLFGTTYLALDAYKSFYFFLICSFFPLAFVLKNRSTKLVDKPYSKGYHLFHLCLTLSIILIILMNVSEPKIPTSHEMIDYLDTLVDDKSKVKLYTNYADGSYAEYRGYYCYMDPRGEIFLKKNTHKEDVFKEYIDMENLDIDYRDFLDKYEFDYMLLDKNDNLYMLITKFDLKRYKLLKEDENYALYLRESEVDF